MVITNTDGILFRRRNQLLLIRKTEQLFDGYDGIVFAKPSCKATRKFAVLISPAVYDRIQSLQIAMCSMAFQGS